MKKSLACLLAFLLALWPTTAVWAQSGGNCSIFKSWGTTETLTASDLNTSFTTVGVTNATQACLDGISDSVAGMQTETDPFPSGVESQATSGAGELQRLRSVLSSAFGWTSWYRRDQHVDFTHRATGVSGTPLGRHVTAVALHTWAGSQGWPAITSVAAHTSGISYPANHHLTVSFDATADSGRFGVGQTNARSWYAFHASALTLHHTTALRFVHSTGGMGGGQYGHVTALQISRVTGDGAPNSFGFQEGNDQLILGHITTQLNFEGGAYLFRTTAGQARTGGVQIDIPGAMATSGTTGATLRIGATTTGASNNYALLALGGSRLTGITEFGTPATQTLASAGDLVFVNAAALRWVNAAGASTLRALSVDSSNRTVVDVNSIEIFIANAHIQTTIGANGAASALTANPVGYLKVNVGGNNRLIPFYDQ